MAHGLHERWNGLVEAGIPGERVPRAEDRRQGRNAPAAVADWQRRLRGAVILGDVVAVALPVLGAVVVGTSTSGVLRGLVPPPVLGAAVLVLVLGALASGRCWDPAVLGRGAEETSRVVRSCLAVALLLSVVAAGLGESSLRSWIFVVVPATAVLSLAARAAIRRRLHRARSRGECLRSVLVVGTGRVVEDLMSRAQRAPQHGWRVVAACVPDDAAAAAEAGGVPVVGGLDDVADQARRLGVEVVAVAPGAGWTPRRMRRLAWALEGSSAELVVDPGLMEVGSPRLSMLPVDGLPMLRLTAPRFSGAVRSVKALADRVSAAFLLLLLSPVFAVLALLVRTDGGPALYRQVRIGRSAEPFEMIKFRSMSAGSEKMRAPLALHNDAAGPLFKLRSDPRVTRLGAVLRRYSLDELPQLVNVVRGSMSLVGPRPPLPEEVAGYTEEARRKFLVRPGVTGLWQVSGRSDLSWEESVRLDLRYVENWSPALDLVILWRTVGAVVRGRGAY